VTGACCPPTKAGRIRIGKLDSKDPVTLLSADSSSAYGSGHLLFSRDGTLMAQQFDPRSAQLAGDPFPVAEGVGGEGSRYTSFSVSEGGILVYAHGAISALASLTWFDRSGKALGALGDSASYLSVTLSPDGRRAAATIVGGTPVNRDVWVIDVGRGVPSRLTFDPGADFYPIWSPDSGRVAFTSIRSGQASLRVKPANGTVNDEPLLEADKQSVLVGTDDWSPDGRFIAYSATTEAQAGSDIWVLPLSDDVEKRKSFPFAQGPGPQSRAAFAPDGRWIAYSSDESGTPQIYVRPFPATGGQLQVSKSGGQQPLWRGDGQELFFLAPDGTMMATTIDTSHEFQAGIPQPLFATRAVVQSRQQYAVSRDGKRFIVIAPEQNPSDSPLTVVVNWLAAVQK
jgi:hypothetical protein